jgi:Fe-S cluster assembly protein SufD
MIKGASRKGGRGVFQGRIEVARGAQRTDARQYHHGLLLEEGAEIYAKPELEIYADDVQCAHGNTAGALDEAALFYMRSRGIGEAAARALLTEAFLLEAVPEDLPGREEIVARIQSWLSA